MLRKACPAWWSVYRSIRAASLLGALMLCRRMAWISLGTHSARHWMWQECSTMWKHLHCAISAHWMHSRGQHARKITLLPPHCRDWHVPMVWFTGIMLLALNYDSSISMMTPVLNPDVVLPGCGPHVCLFDSFHCSLTPFKQTFRTIVHQNPTNAAVWKMLKLLLCFLQGPWYLWYLFFPSFPHTDTRLICLDGGVLSREIYGHVKETLFRILTTFFPSSLHTKLQITRRQVHWCFYSEMKLIRLWILETLVPTTTDLFKFLYVASNSYLSRDLDNSEHRAMIIPGLWATIACPPCF